MNKENYLEQQNYYLNLIAELMSVRKRGETPLAFIHTYGCQQNVADSEKKGGQNNGDHRLTLAHANGKKLVVDVILVRKERTLPTTNTMDENPYHIETGNDERRKSQHKRIGVELF